jgi:cytochrome c oxidase subunit 1
MGKGSAVFTARKLVLAHFWVPFAAFLVAVLLGAGQMYVRSPLSSWIKNPEYYYRSVTGHGTIMAYVLPTFIAMGFGYAICELSLKRPLIGQRWAWAGFWLAVAGTVMAAATVAAGKASVLYTFYPPMIGSPFYYLGVVLVVVGSWIWVALMAVNLRAWKKDNPGAPVPLAMYGNVAGAYLWAWTSVGAASELLILVLPASLGLTDFINVGLARVLFSWTLHAIVYFWLIPVYVVFYAMVPRAIGGRLYSDLMGRAAFAFFLVMSMPIGIHHLYGDPQVGMGFKFLHAVMTAMIAVPTLLTVFTIVASVEIAGRLRGGKGTLGWIKALPWGNPMMLAVTFSFILLGFGGAGGLINMSYQLDETIHNTQWITGHFHMIFGGTVVIMYFMMAYELWPQLTHCGALPRKLVNTQLWLWFIGIMVLTVPWHWVGLLGMPRRMAYYDYSDPALAGQDWTVTLSTLGGVIMLASAALFVFILFSHRKGDTVPEPYRFSEAVHEVRIPAVLNGFGLWVAMMIALTLVNYGYPIAQLAATKEASVPVVPIGGR